MNHQEFQEAVIKKNEEIVEELKTLNSNLVAIIKELNKFSKI